jgi:hypothetical protein
LAVLVITLAASYPMVAVYAWLIEPGHPQEYYVEAAQWIAPWSSHVLGPLVFFTLNYWLARRQPRRHALLFAVATVVAYVVIDFGALMLMDVPLSLRAALVMSISLAAKLLGALLGGWLGSRSAGQPRNVAA